MVIALRMLFAGVLVVMLAVTTVASLERGVLEAGAVLWPDAWFRATLVDAYCAFLTVFTWMAYKERSLAARAVWLVLLVSGGSITIALYVLIQLWRRDPNEPLERVLLRAPART